MISVTRLTPEDEADIKAFNDRLTAGDAGFQFPAHLRDFAVPTEPGAPLWTEVWIARDERAVRGGFLLKHERLLLRDEEVSTGNYQLPLSEGTVDRRFATVGLILTQKALAEEPALYSLGMGGLQRPLPRLLKRLGWNVEEVPFFFRVIRGIQFAKHIRVPPSSRSRQVILRALDVTKTGGLLSAGWTIAATLLTPRATRPITIDLLRVASFDARADLILKESRRHFVPMLDRSSAALNLKYQKGDPRFHRLIVESGRECLGWLVLTLNKLKDHKQFGSLHLGCIVDGLVPEPLLVPALRQAVRYLADRGADLVVSNQTHRLWQQALSANLFARGPSNFVLARSPAMLPDTSLNELHINRGDGDGPINL